MCKKRSSECLTFGPVSSWSASLTERGRAHSHPIRSIRFWFNKLSENHKHHLSLTCTSICGPIKMQHGFWARQCFLFYMSFKHSSINISSHDSQEKRSSNDFVRSSITLYVMYCVCNITCINLCDWQMYRRPQNDDWVNTHRIKLSPIEQNVMLSRQHLNQSTLRSDVSHHALGSCSKWKAAAAEILNDRRWWVTRSTNGHWSQRWSETDASSCCCSYARFTDCYWSGHRYEGLDDAVTGWGGVRTHTAALALL